MQFTDLEGTSWLRDEFTNVWMGSHVGLASRLLNRGRAFFVLIDEKYWRPV
jgi:hypothetical protein